MDLLIILLFRVPSFWRAVCCVCTGFFGALHTLPKLQAFVSEVA